MEQIRVAIVCDGGAVQSAYASFPHDISLEIIDFDDELLGEHIANQMDFASEDARKEFVASFDADKYLQERTVGLVQLI